MDEQLPTVVVGPDGQEVALTAEQAEMLRVEVERKKAERVARLDALGASLVKKRKEAIEYRKSTGIEQEWDEDDDAYEGVDEASKAQGSANRTRPVGQLMPKVEGEVRSTVVLNITKPYCNAFASKIIDMRLQINDRAWAFRPTPVPQLQEMAKSQKSVTVNGETVPEAELAKTIMARAVQAAEKAQTRVDDWLTESRWDGEARQCIDDMSRIGTAVLKGPFPEKCVYTISREGRAAQVESIEPKSRRMSARNLFPDPACGENVHDGDYVWERDYLTAKRMQELKDLPGYIAEQIDAVLEEGPRSPEVEHDPGKPLDPAQKSQPFQVWYFTGNLDRDDIEAAGCQCEEERPTMPAIVTMVNDRVIRASLNQLDNGKFPYDVAPCSRREGHWAGIGIARELRTPQRMITGAVRQMMENAGLSAGPQIVLRRGVLEPADGDYTITPRKIWYVGKDADIQQVQHAFMVVNIDCRQPEMMAIITFALKMCEDVTGLPMILQGQQGKAPDVLGVVQILNENATSVARRVAKMFDDNLLEPHIGRYYDWLMQYGEDDSEKGDYTIDVMTPPDVMADKQAITEMGQLAQDPAFGVDKRKLFAEIARANRFDPARIQYSEDDWKKIQQQPAPQDPRIEVANIRAEADQQIEAAKLRFEQQDNERSRQLEIALATLDNVAKGAELTAAQKNVLAEIRQKLADTVMKLRTQTQLSRESMVADIHKHRTTLAAKPPTEPKGRARPGQAFQH